MSGVDLLERIVASKRVRVDAIKRTIDVHDLISGVPRPGASTRFRDRLLAGPHVFITEVKRGSPSKGLFAPELDPAALAARYQSGGADAISVVTEEDHFFALPNMFADVRGEVTLPVLQKDFFIDPIQIHLAKKAGADLILLIAAVLEESELSHLLSVATMLGLEVIAEVHDEADLEKVLRAGALIIGVNNRNLRDFSVDLDTTARMRSLVPSDCALIGESGIKTGDDLLRVADAGAHGFLIGESLVTDPDPVGRLASLRAAVGLGGDA